MRYQHRRISDIVFNDPTRNLQLLGALCSWARGVYALAFDPLRWNPTVATVLFAYVPPEAWAVLVLVLGSLQWYAAGTRRWRLKFWVANLQIALVVYGLAVTLLTVGPGGQGVPLGLILLVLQTWVATRALHDKELNGTDRREHWAADGRERWTHRRQGDPG